MAITLSPNASASIEQSDQSVSLFERVLSPLIRMAEKQFAARQRNIDALNALSDEELQARGLSREDIVRHVFRDKLCC